MTRVLARLVKARPLDNPDDPVEDLAAVLHERVTCWLDSDATRADIAHVTGYPGAVPATSASGLSMIEPDDPACDAIIEIESLIRARVEAITVEAIQTRPAWMRPLGEQPQGELDGARWRDAVALVASYRDLNEITSAAPLGSDPGGDRTERQRRRAAAGAATTARDIRQPTIESRLTR